MEAFSQRFAATQVSVADSAFVGSLSTDALQARRPPCSHPPHMIALVRHTHSSRRSGCWPHSIMPGFCRWMCARRERARRAYCMHDMS
jgi:hypothetical protein